MLFNEGNRQVFLWDRRDTCELFLALAILALALCGGAHLLNRFVRKDISARAGHFVILLFAIVLTQVIPPDAAGAWISAKIIYALVWGAGLFFSLWSLRHPANKVRVRLWSFLTALWIVPYLVFINLLHFPPLLSASDFPVPSAALGKSIAPPVIWFCFDSIARGALMNSDGQVRSDMPYLRAFQDQSWDFTKATSSGKCTMISKPNFFLQRNPDLSHHSTTWKDEFLRDDSLSHTNGLFYVAKQQGYRTALVGFYLPYTQMLGGVLDLATVFPYDSFVLGSRFHHRVWNHAMGIVRYLRGPFPLRWQAYIPHLRYTISAHNRYYAGMNLKIRQLILDYFQSSMGNGDLLVADIPIPHDPFLFLPDGTVSTQATYDTQLQFSDKVFGAFYEALRSSSHFNRSWVIFTSDHGEWSTQDAEKNHVPLLIKPPAGTFIPQRVNSPLNMWEMGPFFRAVFTGNSTEECLVLLTGNVTIDSGQKNK